MNACNQLIRGTLRHRAGPPSRLLNSTSIFSPPSCTVVKVYGFEPAPLMMPHIRSQPYSGTTFICHDHHDHHAVEMPNLKKSTEVSSQGREKELGEDQENDIDDEVEWEDMFVQGPGPKQEQEWGGPTRGGRMQEPTRFGDWERKGRCTDF
mmetsp:Transcript_17978/g.34026  ORF Transcript_17978/g.34026 Transcript_17978/m.34026 type:complete len:151 (-) Transcript_17978:419-871(-)